MQGNPLSAAGSRKSRPCSHPIIFTEPAEACKRSQRP
ncbi:hypothetical protein SYN63AY4M2_07920 [Synechococcus sp. 63AY4M2]|nr:hypothetical protein SYN63AY4M2_07920 [Synechococcus sp. 63AY4M2]PIK89828.1 hypothetical protein SYN65AY6A5_11635 [Synechococcus sp. 65AY6A5]PIK93158.1 hypothetical protein SYN65AY6LI_05395 [Synechococcus sp. 65AY6Li]PIK96463.1 hypothetical protein SYN60AY4M2_08520 [Synechococcus sp. 60AY4M2]PIK99062.1 hypothetical protein SYN63AY4M1_05920 [Synechococcus sp. 63AY4M1]PIL02492.1 hypothetical protein SYN65AY640_08135 [Synechococcus sp. 65AY640]